MVSPAGGDSEKEDDLHQRVSSQDATQLAQRPGDHALKCVGHWEKIHINNLVVNMLR